MKHSEYTLSNLSVKEQRKQDILDGIRQNLSYKQISYKIGIRGKEVLRDINIMRRHRDPGLLDAQRIAESKIDIDKKAVSVKRDKMFYNMTGMTFQEKSFQNMVYFYKPELNKILQSEDQVTAIQCLSSSVRKTLVKNQILVKKGQYKVSQRAYELLLE